MRPSCSTRVQAGLATSCNSAAANRSRPSSSGSSRQAGRAAMRLGTPGGRGSRRRPRRAGPGPAGSPSGRWSQAELVQGRPVDRPVGRAAGRRREHSRHPPNSRQPVASRLGTIGRRSQCVPESRTAVRKSARTYLYRARTTPSSSTLRYSPSMRSDGSVSRRTRSGVEAPRPRPARPAGPASRATCTRDGPTKAEQRLRSRSRTPPTGPGTEATGSPASSSRRRAVERNAPVSVSRTSNSRK